MTSVDDRRADQLTTGACSLPPDDRLKAIERDRYKKKRRQKHPGEKDTEQGGSKRAKVAADAPLVGGSETLFVVAGGREPVGTPFECRRLEMTPPVGAELVELVTRIRSDKSGVGQLLMRNRLEEKWDKEMYLKVSLVSSLFTSSPRLLKADSTSLTQILKRCAEIIYVSGMASEGLGMSANELARHVNTHE